MSAWLVSKRHIDAVVGAAIAHRVIDRSAADETGAMLWQANADNLAHLYTNLGDDERELPAYTYAPYPIEGPDAVHKTIQCLDYQSCDQPGHEDSPAGRLLAQLAELVAASVGTTSEGMYDRSGWASAPWGIE